MSVAAAILTLAQAWLWIGAAIAAAFLTFGLGRIDPDARGAFVFRVLLVPGVLLIWPLVLWRWWRIERGAPWMARYRPPTAHASAACAMSALIVVALILSLGARQEWPADIAPRQITEAG